MPSPASTEKSVAIVFLNCTKNTELTNACFARTVSFALSKKMRTNSGRAPTGIAFEITHSNHTPGQRHMKSEQWTTYRTRFLVKAKQLSSALSFVDALGRQHAGRKGDYLVESSDGVISIAPRQIFEDIYVPMTLLGDPGTGEIMIGEARVSDATAREPEVTRRNFAGLEIERVKFGKQPIGRQRVEERPHDDDTRVRRKLPQPCRDRRASTPRLGLM